jgi:putative ABC transport system ATP-binding protein
MPSSGSTAAHADSSVTPGATGSVGQALIDMTAIHKTYVMGDQEVRALDGVDLQIYAGEFVAIMGPSGSGKSTLMHILGLLDAPSSGSYLLEGLEVAVMDDIDLARTRNRVLGFVFQSFNLLPSFTAEENVELPMVYGGIINRRKRARVALERVGLGHRMDHKPNELSGGQQQRVAIARAIASEPSILMADEPTGNVGTHQGEEIMEIFQELNDQGITVVLVTHEPHIARHSRRLVQVRDGKIVADAAVQHRLFATEWLANPDNQAADILEL